MASNGRLEPVLGPVSASWPVYAWGARTLGCGTISTIAPAARGRPLPHTPPAAAESRTNTTHALDGQTKTGPQSGGYYIIPTRHTDAKVLNCPSGLLVGLGGWSANKTRGQRGAPGSR
jgi:hypothetical protein